jgi:hypothetical protein
MTEQFQSLANIDLTNQEELENWLANIQTIYQANETEHFSAILTDLTNLTQLAPDFGTNNSIILANLKTQIGFVLNTLAEHGDPRQLVQQSQVRRASVASQLAEQKAREQKNQANSHSRNLSLLANNKEVINQEITQKINTYLTKISTEWQEIITTNDVLQQKNIPFIKELLPIVANSLTTNTKETYQSLLTNWTTNYPQWDDKARWDRTKLELYLKAYETPPRSNSISEEVEELKLEIENWQKKYQVVRQQVAIKSKEWSQANARINTEVTKAIRSTTAKFASFVNPNDAISLEKAAKDKLHMATPAELEAEVDNSQTSWTTVLFIFIIILVVIVILSNN